jgi:hypothetical protein
MSRKPCLQGPITLVDVPVAEGTFTLTLTPGPLEAAGAINRFDLVKTWSGELTATGIGVMLSGGDPATGAAGYVALETVTGTLGGRSGGFALQQLGRLRDGTPDLTYVVTPGSGTGELSGLRGELTLVIDDDGTHRYRLDYEL